MVKGDYPFCVPSRKDDNRHPQQENNNMKSRMQLDTEIFPLIRKLSRESVQTLLMKKYRVMSIGKLTNDQLESFISFLKEPNAPAIPAISD